MAKKKDIPVYLFTGFLDAGKTHFIQDTLEDPRFNNGERTLLLLCEDGEEELNPARFSGPNVFIEPVEEPEELNPEHLAELLAKHKAERVLVECNGMWLLDDLFKAFPEGWMVYQEFSFADARCFENYNANMRQLVYDKLKSCEIIVFNRCDASTDTEALHKIVRGISRRCDIAYEDENGDVTYDEIEDPLPFDLEAEVTVIEDRDYALWYRDMSEDMEKYQDKTVRFKGLIVKSPRLPSDCVVFGRHVMTCCEADIQYAGLVCQTPRAKELPAETWAMVTATIDIRWHKGYGRKGPVLSAVDIAPCEQPDPVVATFY